MTDQIYIGNFGNGLKTNPLAFNIDNDAFPTLYNFYCWRGRIKKKRGTSFLGRLTIQVQLVSGTPLNWQTAAIPLVASGFNGTANLLVGLETGSTVTPGSITITINSITYTEPSPPDGTLTSIAISGSTINYATGDVFIKGFNSGRITGNYSYYPNLPVMGLEDWDYYNSNEPVNIIQYPLQLSFDTSYAYQIFQTTSEINYYNVTYYKSTDTPFTWTGANFQQFWTTNYQGALWATNNKPGLHFLNGNVQSGSQTNTLTFQFNIPGGSTPYTSLIPGDVLWFNEWGNPSPPVIAAISNFQIVNSGGPNPVINGIFTVNSTVGFFKGNVLICNGLTTYTKFNGGYIIINNIVGNKVYFPLVKGTNYNQSETGTLTLPAGPSSTFNNITGIVTAGGTPASGTYPVTFTGPQTGSGTGIVQLLTASLPGQDGIRYYDGDPTNGTGLPGNGNLNGWVNFAPPLTGLSVAILDLTQDTYYLVGALAILDFKDRLLFFSPYIQSSTSVVYQLDDTVLWSWNGTPYYTQSDINTPSINVVPVGQVANASAYYVDQSGKGGYLSAGIPQPIVTVSANEDVLLIGFGGDGRKTRFVYTGNDLQPFLFFSINSELPSSATFSAITMDKGVIDIGQYGIAATDQQSSERIDLDIPDAVFQIQALNNGAQRVNAVRDFSNEWIFFAYPYADSAWVFPTQTLLYNYRNNTWALFYENFTAHGTYRAQLNKTWLTLPFKTWLQWREPWNAGSGSAQFPEIIAGNPQGYVLKRSEGTNESVSGSIQAISGSGYTQITSQNHCVAVLDYLQISGCLGTTAINGMIGQVNTIIDANNFIIDIPVPSGVYVGLGEYTRLCLPILKTKQFPLYWDKGRKLRLGVQKYLMDRTSSSQVTVNLYLSQDNISVWNNPQFGASQNSTIYSQILNTCPETGNLQMQVASTANQIWHRFNTSVIGDSVQVGITLSDTQMRNLQYATDEIVLHGMQLNCDPGPILC